MMRSPLRNIWRAKAPKPFSPAFAILYPGILASSLSATVNSPPTFKNVFISGGCHVKTCGLQFQSFY